ncbi:branched-chain amino acid ABC transporter permease [Bradyrhizobium sp. CCGB12]|uniref:branched-chain amino acid ABC transporter permease n=1 Tax=Bradyrhizobium sp. CCGB12 TaxID=2949632 RepID=UPI0020B25F25|nr:branched-chain amino acid ABC transporter permease [Bradyrhizobium sp. CCGB12]MCP3387765.1 branched-chain amino acid ABC transporter permease [Bradyrhizobium sp. CCGB12]
MLGQYLVNGLLIGGLYACLAVGFSLVWGVLNIVNMLHGSMVVLGAYLCLYGVQELGLPLYLVVPVACVLLFLFGYAVQRGLLNRVVMQPILITLTLTFGLDLIVNNLILHVFTATPRSLVTNFGMLDFAGVRIPVARVGGMLVAVVLTLLLYWLLRHSKTGRAIIAVRMDRHAAALMGIRIPHIYALTFGIGALMAGAAGCALALIYPITPMMSGVFLGKAFVICVLGGLGSVPGAILGGIMLGIVEGLGTLTFGQQWATSVGFMMMMAVIVLFPTGLAGKKGYE